MGKVKGNIRPVKIIQVTAGPNNTSMVKGDRYPYEKWRFENETLKDSAGTEFEILSNTNIYVTVKNKENVTPKLGSATLRDDDHLQNGEEMPMPDTSRLDEALAKAYVVPVYDVPGSDDNVPFVLNNQAGQENSVKRRDSKAMNRPSFWVVYLLGAFQGSVAQDNDPSPNSDNQELGPVLGVANKTYGGALIYMETIVDVSR